MSRYRKIDPKIWNDQKFNSLSDNAKLVFFLLLTHPHMTAVGAMRNTVAGLAEELGWETKAFREAFREACIKGMVTHNQKAHFIGLPNFMKYNAPENPNVIVAWGKCLDDVPECPEKSQLYYNLQALLEDYSEAFRKAFRKAFAKPIGKQEQEQEHKQKQEEDNNASRTETESLPLTEEVQDNGIESPKPKDILEEKAAQVISHLNEARQLEGRYQFTSTNGSGLKSRLKEGASVEDCYLVIDHAVSRWGGDDEMDQYIRPVTLFGEKKFRGYLIAARSWDKQGRPSRSGKDSLQAAHTRPTGYYDQLGEK